MNQDKISPFNNIKSSNPENIVQRPSNESEVIELELSNQLKEKFEGVFYDKDNSILNVYVNSEKSKPIVLKSKVDKSSMRNTIEQFNERADGTLDKETKALLISSIRFQLTKYIKFDDTEQKWYSENYPDDPIVEGQGSNNIEEDEEKN